MSRPRVTVVLSQAQGKNPSKRALEESVAAALILEPGLDVSIVPHLYDLDAEHTGRLYLESVTGDLVVLAWLYPRAAFWLLDRDGIRGHYVENQDACKKGCPACSRVCPENAIMFPEHKTPGIAGAAAGAVSGLKIDLTRLFGGTDAISVAAQERDAELVKDGRQAVGLSVGIPRRQQGK